LNDPVWPGLAEYRAKNSAKESGKPPHSHKENPVLGEVQVDGGMENNTFRQTAKDAEEAWRKYLSHGRAAAVPHGSGRLEFFLTSGSANDELVRRRIR